jgi:hypothetical protein
MWEIQDRILPSQILCSSLGRLVQFVQMNTTPSIVGSALADHQRSGTTAVIEVT